MVFTTVKRKYYLLDKCVKYTLDFNMVELNQLYRERRNYLNEDLDALQLEITRNKRGTEL